MSDSEEEFQGDESDDDYQEEGAAEDGDDSDDDVPISSLKSKKLRITLSAAKTTALSNGGSKKRALPTPDSGEDVAGDDEDESSDDDIPLASLAKTKNKKAAASPKKNGTKVSKAKPAAAPPKKKAKKKPIVKRQESSMSSGGKKSDVTTASSALYSAEISKGKMIQALLCRWWYAIEWPDPEAIPAKPLKNYDSLDGFPGVYVATSGDNVGHIKDIRDKEKCPSFANFVKMPSSELKELLLKALQEQKKQLLKHEGTGTPTEKEIDNMVKWVEKVKPEKSDKEAVKVLKAAGFK